MQDGSSCSTGKGDCKKMGIRCLIPVIAVFVFLELYGMLVHGKLLMDDYLATAHLWRTQEEMEAIGPWWMVYYALLSMVLTCWFKKTRACLATPCGTDSNTVTPPTRCPVKSGGMCFGLKLGLLMGLMMGSSFLYMPIPFDLAVKWFFTGLFEGLGVGIILGMTYRDSNRAISGDKA